MRSVRGFRGQRARAGGLGARLSPRLAESGGRRAPCARVGAGGGRDPGSLIPSGGCAAGRARRDGGQAEPRGLHAAGEPGAPGGRALWAQTKPGADAPRRLGPPRGWSLGREERRLRDDGRGLGERPGRPPCGRPGGLLGGGGNPDRVGAALSCEPTCSSRAAAGSARARLRKGESVGGLALGEGLRANSAPGWGLGFGGAGDGPVDPSKLVPGKGTA